MEIGLVAGFSIFLLAAFFNGIFALPQKFVKNFAWENTWGSFYLFTMIIIPALVIPFFVDNIAEIWKTAGYDTVAMTVIFGVIWGVGCITFGYAVSMIGLSLGFTIIMGIATSTGALLPLVFQHPEELGTTAGNITILGIVVSVVGITFVGYAGILKDRALKYHEPQLQTQNASKRSVLLGLFIGVISGITSACLNLGFSFAVKITDIATDPQFGNPPWAAGLVSWLLLFWGGFACAGGFALILLFKNKTWRKFTNAEAKRNLLLTFAQGAIHFVNIVLYGIGAHHIGKLGTSLGFAAYMSLAIIAANVFGFVTKEWKGVGKKPVIWIIAAMMVLIVSVCILGYGNSIRQKSETQSATTGLQSRLSLRSQLGSNNPMSNFR